MESQQHPLVLSTLAHAIPASSSSAEQDKVVASLSTLPSELKLQIVEEIWENPRMLQEAGWGRVLEWGDLHQVRKTRMKELSLVDKQFYELSAKLRWRDVDLCNRSLLSLHFFLFVICRKHGASIRNLHINRHSDQWPLLVAPVSTRFTADQTLPLFHHARRMTWVERNLLFEQAEELEKRMKGSTTRYAAGNCKNSEEFRGDIEGVFLSYILRTCPGLCELQVIGCGLLKQAFFPPSLQSLRSLALQLGAGQAHPNLAFLRQSPHLQQLSLTWLGRRDEVDFHEIISCLRQLHHLTSLTLNCFQPPFFAGPPVIDLQLKTLRLVANEPEDPAPLTYLQSFAPTLCHLHLNGFAEPANPPPNEPLLPHLVSLNPPHLWHALGFAGPVGGDKKA